MCISYACAKCNISAITSESFTRNLIFPALKAETKPRSVLLALTLLLFFALRFCWFGVEYNQVLGFSTDSISLSKYSPLLTIPWSGVRKKQWRKDSYCRAQSRWSGRTGPTQNIRFVKIVNKENFIKKYFTVLLLLTSSACTAST